MTSAVVSARRACRPSTPVQVCASVGTGACMTSEMRWRIPGVGALLQRSGRLRTWIRDGKGSGTRTKGTIACRVRASQISQWTPLAVTTRLARFSLAHARLSMLALYVHSLGRGHEHTYPPFPQVSLWLFCETDRRRTCCLDYMAKDHWNGETFKAPPTPTTNNSCPGLGDPTHHRGQCLSVAWAKKLRRRVVYLSPSREHIHTRQNPCPPRTVRRTQCPGG